MSVSKDGTRCLGGPVPLNACLNSTSKSASTRNRHKLNSCEREFLVDWIQLAYAKEMLFEYVCFLMTALSISSLGSQGYDSRA